MELLLTLLATLILGFSAIFYIQSLPFYKMVKENEEYMIAFDKKYPYFLKD